MTSRSAGLGIALAAILVQAPRLVLSLLAADRLPVAAGTERALLVIAGVGTAVVLTGGNLYLAHTVAQVKPWRRTLAAAWIAVLAASGGLVLPFIVARLAARTVPQVLGAGQLEWPWAFLASIAHELTAAGCVLASAAWAGTPPTPVPAGAQGSRAAILAAAVAMPAATTPVPAGTAAVTRPPESQPAALVPCRAGCGRSFISLQAEIAHQRHCRKRRLGGSGPGTLPH